MILKLGWTYRIVIKEYPFDIPSELDILREEYEVDLVGGIAQGKGMFYQAVLLRKNLVTDFPVEE